MALNISIDVDGTLLDADENLVPQARESLRRLKAAGYCLQLWSAAGADYAHKCATKHDLAGFFDSYATKPDVAIDDLPQTAKPLAVIHGNQKHTIEQATTTALSIEQNVDAALTLDSNLVSFVKQLQAQETTIRAKYGNILRPDIPLHPIPFFGVVANARVITIGLNPSSTEFEEVGRWPNTLTPCELTHRLVNYFRLPGITPHYWFTEPQRAMEFLHCPYYFAAAHVDVSPWSTYSPTHFARQRPQHLESYNELLAAGLKECFPQTLKFCRDKLKVVIVCSSDEPKQKERDRFPLIEEATKLALGSNWNRNGFFVMSKSDLPRWAWENRDLLRRLLELENVYC